MEGYPSYLIYPFAFLAGTWLLKKLEGYIPLWLWLLLMAAFAIALAGWLTIVIMDFVT
jgi:ABC-type uncharacterized transport system permease subunit